MLLTLASTGLFMVVFVRSFGMTSRALALSAFNMDVTVASRLSAHHLKREDHRQVNKQFCH
jgi:hypothetical protein